MTSRPQLMSQRLRLATQRTGEALLLLATKLLHSWP